MTNLNKTLFVDGVYTSYWVSKIGNMFIKKGKKKKTIKHFNKCLLQIKFNNNINPLIYIFEIIDNIKPTFKLEHSFPGKVPVVYPKTVKLNKRYNVAIRWIQLFILENKYNSIRTIIPFYKQLFNSFNQLATLKSNLLIKKRDQYHQDAVTLQENIRYTWIQL